MFGFTRKTDYALVALATLAERDNGADLRLSARQISERHEVPLPLLMNVLKGLVSQGLVTSKRGSKGGYSLAQEPSGITVHQVIAATEGPVKVMACCSENEPEDTDCHECRVAVTCPITVSVRRLNDRINTFLGEITLADLMADHGNAIRPISSDGIQLEFRPLAKGDR